MALILSDRVRETTTTTGTGAFSLGGAATGYRAFSSVMANADTTYYTCAGQGTSEWEVGIGTWNTGNTLSRTTILASSNGGSAVTFSAGTKDIFITYTAAKVVIQDASGNVGIGTSSPAYKLDVTGTMGVSSAVTLSGGTANGVAYLNGSKVLTTGSALTFDGSTFGVTGAATVTGDISTTSTGRLNVRGSGTGINYDLQIDNSDTLVNFRASRSNAVIKSYAWYLDNSVTEAMRLTSTGLGIGTSSPGVKLDVTTATAGFYAARIFNTSITGYGLKIKNGIDSNDALRISNAADSADNILMYGSGNAYFAGSVSAGAGIGARGASISVSGSTDSSPIAAKSGSYATVFGVLPHSNSWTYLSTGVYYQNGVWTHASANTNSALLGLSGNNGGAWWASSNSSASWNLASAVGLWNASGRWVSDVTAPVDVRAPIFYDSNDTSYYGDFAGNSVFYYANYKAASGGSNSNGVPAIKIAGLSNYDSLELGIQDNYIAQIRTYGNDIYYYAGHWRTSGSAATENHSHKWFTSKSGSTNWNVQKMELNHDGDLGIGVSPGYRLDLSSGASGSKMFRMTASGTGRYLYGYADSGGTGITNSDPYSSGSLLYMDGTVTYMYSGGSIGGEVNGSSFRSSIFYDRNDTAYYGDFASVSLLSGLDVYGGGLYDDQTGFRLPLPGQAAYVTSASSVTGAIKVRIPTAALGSNTMCAFTVSVYTYDGLSFDIRCGGYNYSDASKTWYNIFAYMTSASRGALNVRFGWDGTSQCIWIGELGTSWSYPQVTVRDFMGGYAGFTGPNWRSGWSVSFEASSFYSVSQTATVYPLPYTSNNTGDIYTPRLYDSNNTAYYVDPASTSVIRKTNLVAIGSGWDDGLNLYSSDGSNRWNLLVDSGASNYLRFAYNQSEKFQIQPGGAVISYGDMRAPIFYDQNNTAYYGDFASTSNLNVLAVQRAYAGYDAGVTGSFSCNAWFRSQGSTGWYNESYGGGIYMYDSTWVRVYNSKNFLVEGGYGQSDQSWRAPIFYDSNNTAYYVDPTSSGTSLRAQGDWRSDSSAWSGEFAGKIQYHSSYWYLQASNGWFFRDAAGNNVFQVNSSGYVGVGTVSPTAYMSGTSGIQIYHASYPAVGFANSVRNWLIYGTTDESLRVWNNSTNDRAYFYPTYTQFAGSARAPIFYDSDDTTFYVDPNGGSVLTNVYTYNSSYGFYARYTAGSNNYTGYYNWYGLQLGNNGANYIVAGRTAGGGNLRIYVNNTGDFPGTLGGTHSSTFDSDGIFYNYFSVRTPIFYDSNNTGYYVDPNSTSQLHYVLADNWFRPQGNTGVYWQTYAYYLYKNPDTYGNLRLGENPQNSYVGIQYFYSSSRSTTMFDSSGNGGLYNYTYWIYYWSVGNACLGVKTSTTSSSYALYVDGGIYATGNITAYSDARKKTNIVTVDNALGLVNKMRGVFYNRIDSYDQKIDTNKRQVGVIAQEVNEVLPEVVTYAKDVDEYGVQYGNLAGVFIEAIKELTAKVTALEAKLAEVK